MAWPGDTLGMEPAAQSEACVCWRREHPRLWKVLWGPWAPLANGTGRHCEVGVSPDREQVGIVLCSERAGGHCSLLFWFPPHLTGPALLWTFPLHSPAPASPGSCCTLSLTRWPFHTGRVFKGLSKQQLLCGFLVFSGVFYDGLEINFFFPGVVLSISHVTVQNELVTLLTALWLSYEVFYRVAQRV